MRDRLFQIMTSKGFSQTTFSAKLGISAASLSSIFTGRTRPTSNHVAAIHKAFPEVSIGWLMFGEGEMYSSEKIDAGSAASIDGSDEANQSFTENDEAATSSSRNALDGQDSAKPARKSSTTASHDAQHPYSYGGTKTPYVHSEGEGAGVKNPDTKQRHIKEIRIFFDDGTYEVFAGNKPT